MSVKFREVFFRGKGQASFGKIYLHSMPGRFEPWADFVMQCQSTQVKQILCLAAVDEIKEMSPDYYRSIGSKELPAQINNCAVPDFSIPQNFDLYRQCIETSADRLLIGENILIHCAAGIGRTGTAAACLLAYMSIPTEQAVSLVEAAGSRAETNKQQIFINHFAVQINYKITDRGQVL